MPAVAGKSSLAAKLDKRGVGKAVATHKDDETEFGGGGELPPGINGGVAELVEAKLSEFQRGDNKGELYVQFKGVIQAPEEFAGRPVYKSIPLCDDPKSWENPRTFEDRVAELLNEFRKLDIPTTGMSGTGQEIEDTLSVLAETRPLFKFHTWAPRTPDPTPKNPNPKPPRTRVDFDGSFKGNAAELESSAGTVEDNSGDGGEPAGDTEDWDVLGAVADAGDEVAQKQIKDMGEQLGIDTDAAESWAAAASEVAAALESGAGGAEGGGDDTPAEPTKDSVWMYRPPKARKDIEVQVTAVFEKARTANIKSLADGKLFRGVSWDDLKAS